MQKVCLGVFLGAPTTGRKGKGQDWAQREIRLCWSLHEALGSPTRGSGAGVSLQSCPELEKGAWVALGRRHFFGKTAFFGQGSSHRGLTPRAVCQLRPIPCWEACPPAVDPGLSVTTSTTRGWSPQIEICKNKTKQKPTNVFKRATFISNMS